MQSMKTLINVACKAKDTNVSQLAHDLNIGKENFHMQLKRDNFRINDIEKIADKLGYNVELSFIDKDTNVKLVY
jgi:hypothetical protein